MLCFSGCREKNVNSQNIKRINLILFTFEDNYSPSKNDLHFNITKRPEINEIVRLLNNAKITKKDTPQPSCEAAGSIDLIDQIGNTSRYFIVHIHNPEYVLLRNDNEVMYIDNGKPFLEYLKKIGYPVEKLFVKDESKL